MGDIAPLIRQLDRRLATERPDYYSLLQPGVTEAELDAFARRFTLALPTAFQQLYRWKNGQHPMSSIPLVGNRTFSPLEDIIETKEIFDGMIGYEFEDPRLWRRGWLPFLHNGGGSHLCVDVLAEDGGAREQLVAFWKADGDRPVEFQDLGAWIANLLSSLDDEV